MNFSDEQMKPFFSGQELFGDNFSEQEIDEWFEDEAEGYAELGAKNRDSYAYLYHAINTYLGFNHLKKDKLNHVLGMGSAYGDELRPILSRISRISIVDPSDAFETSDIDGVPVSYVKAQKSGNLPFPDNSFDLITCFGVLHHIPNVSHVVAELYRCLQPGGMVLIREPITSMNDWRYSRPGLTKRERGLPYNWFNNALTKTGFHIQKASPCFFPYIANLYNRNIYKITNTPFYNSNFAVRIDYLLSKLFFFNYAYYRKTKFQKISPGCVFWVAEKR